MPETAQTENSNKKPPKKPTRKPLAYKPNDVVQLTGLSRSTVFKLLREGKLESTAIGRSRLILARSVEKLLDSEAA